MENDASNEYLNHRENIIVRNDTDEMINWVLDQGRAVTKPLKQSAGVEGEPLPFPTDRPAPEEQSTAGKIMRNVGEIPKQAIAGVDEAGRNALSFLDPLANWLNQNVADLSYDEIDAPETPTGAVTKSVTQFLTGFVPILKGAKLLGLTNKVLAPMAAGAVTDFSVFDPQAARLSNLWQEMGLPENILTDYLASKPEDSAAEGRLKNALEGTGLGTFAEGVLLSARALRATKAVKDAGAAETLLLKEKYGELDDKSFTTLGDPSKPMIQTVVKPVSPAVGKVKQGLKATAAVPAEDVAGRSLVQAGDAEVYVNFARIDGEEDVRQLIGDMATRFKGSIDDATRGVQSQEETVRLADEMGMTVPDLLARRKGQPFNAEEAVAARRIWAASGEKLLETAKRAADPNAGPVDQFNFRKMMATHYAIQAEVIGARTETARALASWRIPAGGGIEKARGIEQMIQAMGGPQASAEMAKRLAILADHGDPAALAKIVQKGWGATSFDAFREAWINGLLSSPKTHIVNMTSNLAVAFSQIYERGAAEQISKLRGSGAVAPGESLAMAYGLVSSIKDAFALAGKALKTGDTGYALNKVDLPREPALSAESFRMGSETGLGRTVDFVGNVARVPSRLLGAEDEFFKTIAYRGELHAQALRQATGEGLKGKELSLRMREILLDPPEHIRINAADAALYNTFTNSPGSIGQSFMSLREKVPAVSLILPFIRTPVNIARFAFERSPLAPLVGQWRDDIAAGGARADLALARMSTGSAIMAMGLDWADAGQISGRGPKDPGEREAMNRQGWQPYSLKVGDRWYSYNRTDPFGMTLGLSADIAESVRHGEMNEDDVDEWQEVAAMSAAAVAQVSINKTYLQGMSDFANVMSDPTRHSEGYINRLISSFIPVTSLMGAVEKAVDPTVRESTTPYEAISAKIAGLSENLPARRNLWGDTIKAESGIGKTYDFFSPIQATTVNPTPIDTELMRLSQALPGAWDALPQRIQKKTTFMGAPVNFKEWPREFERYVQLAGNELPHPAWGVGARDFLSSVVEGNTPMSKIYYMRSDEMKLSFIRDTISQYRTMAQQQMLMDPEYADFAEYVKTARDERMRTRLPVQ